MDRTSLDRCIKLLQHFLLAVVGPTGRFAVLAVVMRLTLGRPSLRTSVLAGRAELYGVRKTLHGEFFSEGVKIALLVIIAVSGSGITICQNLIIL